MFGTSKKELERMVRDANDMASEAERLLNVERSKFAESMQELAEQLEDREAECIRLKKELTAYEPFKGMSKALDRLVATNQQTTDAVQKQTAALEAAVLRLVQAVSTVASTAERAARNQEQLVKVAQRNA